MNQTVTVKNVVSCELKVGVCYPQWSDYGCYYSYYLVIFKDGDIFNQKVFYADDVAEDHEKEVFSVEYASDEIMEEYRQYLIRNRISTSKAYKNAGMAEPGDIIEVVRGRKYPLGLRGKYVKTVQKTVDPYGRVTVNYLVCESLDPEFTKKIWVDSKNACIVGHID